MTGFSLRAQATQVRIFFFSFNLWGRNRKGGESRVTKDEEVETYQLGRSRHNPARNPCDPLSERTFAFTCFLLSCNLENLLEGKVLIERHNLTFLKYMKSSWPFRTAVNFESWGIIIEFIIRLFFYYIILPVD